VPAHNMISISAVIPVPEQYSVAELDSASTLALASIKSKSTKQWTDLGIAL
jgi:hypothetical protein